MMGRLRECLTRGWVRVLGSSLLLATLLFFAPLDRVGEALRSIDPLVFALCLAGFLVVHLIGSLKWWFLVNHAGARLRIRTAIQCYFAGLFGNLFLPSVIGGDVVMAGSAIGQGHARSSVLMGSLLNRLLDLVALVLLAGAAGLMLPQALDDSGRRIWTGVVTAGVLGTLTGTGLGVGLYPDRLPGPARKFIAKYEPAFAFLRRPRLIALPLALSLFIQGSLVGLTAFLGSHCGLELPAAAWLFAWPLAKLAAFAPFTVSGFGARELAIVSLLRPFGVPLGPALVIGLAWDGVLIAGGVAGGIISRLAAMGGRPA